MTENMERLAQAIVPIIHSIYGDSKPTLEDIHREADKIYGAMSSLYPLTSSEHDALISYLETQIIHHVGDSYTLINPETAHKPWFLSFESDEFYWKRYKNYLRDYKHWSAEIVNRLNTTTDGIMDNLGDPNDMNHSFQRRGLLLGDVQSGKTATYTAICNKAADSGYKVIIILAGLTENLRVQTQNRLNKEFTGYENKFVKKRKRMAYKKTAVGVGNVPPLNSKKSIWCFTTTDTDFNKQTVISSGLTLGDSTALFVVKKNKSVLHNLFDWLKENNSDPTTELIDLPLLLIDDEADNASVNTNSEEKDPTVINEAIIDILGLFSKASYLGITATPFANIFIDPTNARDLFPRDFLTVLPTPEQYIGAEKIFGVSTDDDESGRNATYSDAIIPIENEEQEGYFKFKHKKTIAEDLSDLPYSLKTAIGYFILVSAISDLRYDFTEHRSMLVNVSRFNDVQNATSELIEEFLEKLKSDVEDYSQCEVEQALQIFGISFLHHVWEEFSLGEKCWLEWPEFQKNILNKAIRRIEVRTVNQKHGAKVLNYAEYEGKGMRVIAIGGNSLSRGITLEGLIVSYFYRNTQMYDTLLQMGRWFGYRNNYSDLFKIWMAEDAINWYGYITDAVDELKAELKIMERQHQKPEDFGLKVRQSPGSLLVTARNKMRTGMSISRPITVSNRLLETPRLIADPVKIQENQELCQRIILSVSTDKSIEAFSFDTFSNAYIWKRVPKKYIIELVKNFATHPWNLNFQPIALADYITKDDEKLDYWDLAIPQSAPKIGEKPEQIVVDNEKTYISVYPKPRPLYLDPNFKQMYKVYDRHVRIGSGGCTKIGLTQDEANELKKKNGGAAKDKVYLNTNRNPLALIYVLKNSNPQKTDDDPDIVYALGLGFPDSGEEKTANYIVNMTELEKWTDFQDEDDEDDVD